VTLTAAHPAVAFKNSARSPLQMWRLRYAMFFQVPRFSDWWAKRQDFAYVEKLWRRWAAPGWNLQTEHLNQVKTTLRKSWPAPLLHYRSGGLGPDGKPWPTITTPTLYLAGARDGCVSPAMAAGQERYFSGPFRSESISDAGHFLHLEQPEIVGERIVAWLR
jgi:pimeloyl-ACP methyl ester carboxylesterase